MIPLDAIEASSSFSKPRASGDDPYRRDNRSDLEL